MSAELPVVGIMINDSQLRLRIYAMLERHFRLRECTDPTLHQDANLFLLDEAALPMHREWLEATRLSLSPDAPPVLLLVQEGWEADPHILDLVDITLPAVATGEYLRAQLMHWIHLQASARLWVQAAGSLSGVAADPGLALGATTEPHPLQPAGQAVLPDASKSLLFAKLVEQSSQGMFIYDWEGVLLSVNPALCTLLGYEQDELVGRNIETILPHYPQDETHKEFHRQIGRRGRWDGELFGLHKRGDLLALWWTLAFASATQTQSGGYFVGSVTDLSTLRQLEEHVLQLSRTDSLSELNRILVEERLGLDMRQAAITGQKVTLLLVQLRRFRTLNEQYGYAIGDWVLMAQLQRLQQLVGRQGLVSRLSGDHYAIIMPRLDNMVVIDELAGQIIQKLSQPLFYDGKEIHAQPVVGFCDYPERARSATEMLQHADLAVNWCIREAQASFRRFDPELAQQLQQQREREQALQRALAQNEFFLVYQPQLEMSTGKIVGMEALIRWRTAEGVVSPKEFIPLAEQCDLIIPLSNWVLREACRQAAVWMKEGGQLRIAVNLSASHFQHVLLLEQVAACLEESQLPAELLELEVTESCIMADVDGAISTLRALKELGVTLSVDDFGTGYSSLSYLKLFPLDKLKIDQSFVSDLTSSKNDAAIVRAIIALGHAIGLTVIAEGVETQAQFAQLHALQCDEMQGFLYARPTEPERLPALLHHIAELFRQHHPLH